MKKKFLLLTTCSLALISTSIVSCKQESFEDYYMDPGKVTESTPEKQFTGMIYDFRTLVIPSYGNYFVTLRPTLNLYLQNLGSVNQANQLVPGSAAIEERWNKYYQGLAQYKQFVRLFEALPEEEKVQKRSLFLAAKIFFYDQTQQMVDLVGAIPWTEAGELMGNGGNYEISYPKYDQAEDIYRTMIEDLTAINEELKTLQVPANFAAAFRTQDLINNGNLSLWRKYGNSLLLRMLNRVKASSAFSSTATAGIAKIIENPADYPLVLTNADNAQLDIFNVSSDIKSEDIEGAFEADGWTANLASKPMIDLMNRTSDPRMKLLFEAGEDAEGAFIGLDQTLGTQQQTTLANGGTIAIYHRHTVSRNRYLPGLLVTASDVNFLLAEYYLGINKEDLAKAAFEKALEESVALYASIAQKSDNATIAKPGMPTEDAIAAFVAAVNWDGAANKMNLVAEQKWVHFNLFQATENWAENRRLDYPKFEIPTFASDLRRTLPVKLTLPQNEATFNPENYQAVRDQDNADTKLFWDVN